MTYERLQSILSGVRFQHWRFHAGEMGGGHYIQVQFEALDNDAVSDPTVVLQHGRKWPISTHATESEVVTTCLKAVLTAIEHEAREQFTYKGVQLFGPHIDVNALMAVAQQYDVRVPA